MIARVLKHYLFIYITLHYYGILQLALYIYILASREAHLNLYSHNDEVYIYDQPIKQTMYKAAWAMSFCGILYVNRK